jgi:hypothetical protein
VCARARAGALSDGGLLTFDKHRHQFQPSSASMKMVVSVVKAPLPADDSSFGGARLRVIS